MKPYAASAFAATIACLATPTAGSAAEIRRDDFRVISEAGIEIFVREVGEVREKTAQESKPPVILLHGARVPGVASLDLDVDGGSLAADLGRVGHRVFIMDARGYGASSRPGQDGSQEGRPLTHSYEVVRDIGAVVDAVEQRTGAHQGALLGWATGGHWVGMYAAQNPERVSHLVMHNALSGSRSATRCSGRAASSGTQHRSLHACSSFARAPISGAGPKTRPISSAPSSMQRA
ncbi:MAG: alpha/beta fold hydrolase [Burkholderiaceae bacterium]